MDEIIEFIPIKLFKERLKGGLIQLVRVEVFKGERGDELGKDYFYWMKENISKYCANVIGGPIQNQTGSEYWFGKRVINKPSS